MTDDSLCYDRRCGPGEMVSKIRLEMDMGILDWTRGLGVRWWRRSRCRLDACRMKRMNAFLVLARPPARTDLDRNVPRVAILALPPSNVARLDLRIPLDQRIMSASYLDVAKHFPMMLILPNTNAFTSE